MEFDISGARIFLQNSDGNPDTGGFSDHRDAGRKLDRHGDHNGPCIFLTRDLKVEKISKRQAVRK